VNEFNPNVKVIAVEIALPAVTKAAIGIIPADAPVAPKSPITIGSLKTKDSPESAEGYGYTYGKAYWTDYAGPNTSHHVAHLLGFILGELGDKSFDELEFCDGYRGDRYNATRGMFERDGKVLTSVKELRAKFDALVAKYNLDEALIEKWCEGGAGHYDRTWWDTSLEDRFKLFRKVSLSEEN
jgi:hypothetical protein